MTKILTTLKVLMRLLVIRHRIGFRSFAERIAFYLQLNPFTNLLFATWFTFASHPGAPTVKLACWVVRHGFGFGALRNLSPEARARFAALLLPPTLGVAAGSQNPEVQQVLQSLHERGYAQVPRTLDVATVERTQAYFAACEHFAAQVYAQSDAVPLHKDWRDYSRETPFRYICFRKGDSLKFIQDVFKDEMAFLKQIADAYCGFDTALYSMNTFCTIQGRGAGYAMRLHRDYDDFKCLTFFIAWTPTTPENGATLFVPVSHRSSQAPEATLPLNAKPGQIFAVDTFGLHSGNANVQTSRLATWLRFGQSVNLATIQDGE